MINKVILIGNLGRDPEVRYLEGNVAVASFSVATNESYKDKKGDWQTITEWHNIVCWRQLAERAEKQLKKGMLIYLEGKLTHRKYQDKEGNDRYTTEVVANTIRILEKREGRPGATDEAYAASNPAYSNTSNTGGEQQADDDLPF
jgi:single-strand DNA-binding protein